MSPRRAPIALRMPISRVRSVTLTSMMFITPIPPTSSEIAATQVSSVVKTDSLELEASMIELWLITLIPSLTPVPFVEHLGDLRFGFGDGVLGGRLDRDLTQFAVTRERVFDRGDRREDAVVLALRAGGALRFRHPDDLEVDPVHLHRLADGALAGEEFGRHFGADHGDPRRVHSPPSR